MLTFWGNCDVTSGFGSPGSGFGSPGSGLSQILYHLFTVDGGFILVLYQNNSDWLEALLFPKACSNSLYKSDR